MNTKWYILIGCIFSFSIFHANRSLMAVILPMLTDKFGLTYTMAIVLASAYDFGYFASIIAVGYIAGKLDKRISVLLGLGFIAIGSFLSAYLTTFYGLFFIRFISGIGFSFYFTSGNSLITDYFRIGERGKAFGLHTVGSALGRVYGAWIAGFVVIFLPWWWSFNFFGIIVILVTGIVFLLFYPLSRIQVPKVQAEKRDSTNGNLQFLSTFKFWEPTLINSVIFISFLVIVNFLPLFLIHSQGLSLTKATYLVALVSMVAVFANPLIGIAVDYIGTKLVGAIGFLSLSLVSLLTIFLNGNIIALTIFAVLLGLFISGNFSISINLLTESGKKYSSPIAFGFFNSAAVGISLLMSLFAGKFADAWGLESPFILVAGMNLIGGLWMLRRWSTRDRSSVDIDHIET